MDRAQLYNNKLEWYKGQRDMILKNIKSLKSDIKNKEEELKDIQEAQIIIQEVAKQTQEQIKYEISEPVSLAINSIFDTKEYKAPYRFVFDFVSKRNKTECDFYLVNKDNEKENPLEDCGGGLIDIISFALRLSICTIAKTRKVLILDEPFKWIDKSKEEKVGQLLRLIVEKLGFQIIMVTHNNSYIDIADRHFNIIKKEGVSYVNT